jgi:hypothetical protein
MPLLPAQVGETDTMAAAEMCEVEEELLMPVAIPLGLDENEVELSVVTTSMQQVSTTVEDDSTYRVPVSLKVARLFAEELKYFFKKTCPLWSITCNQLL